MEIKAGKSALYHSTKDSQAAIKDERGWISDMIKQSSISNYKN